MPKTIEEIREFFSQDVFATEMGARIESVGDMSAVVSLEVTPHHKNAMGALMGGVSFTLADFAFAVAANHEKVTAVSMDSSISFLGTLKGSRLIARAVCIKDGMRSCFFRVDVTDDTGAAIAAVNITGFKL